MRQPRLLLALIGFTWLLPIKAQMRCGTELIDVGDSLAKVIEQCGEPAVGDPTLVYDFGALTYNFGPNESMMKVIIRQGEVSRIEELGEGFVPGAEPPAELLDERP